MSSTMSLDIKRRSATTTPAPSARSFSSTLVIASSQSRPFGVSAQSAV